MNQVNLRMRELWDERARQDPMYFVDPRSGQHFENIEACYEAGKEQANALMSSMLERLAFDPTGKRILDVGCGFGRLFPGFAELGFTEIWGVDISPEMTRLGEQQCPVPSARFVVVDGGVLTGIDSNYFNFCFSRGVFLHLPEEQALWSYLHEIHRALVPGGTFQLDFAGHPTIKSTALRLIPDGARPWARTLYRFAIFRWMRGGSVLSDHTGGRLPARRTISPKRVVRQLRRVGFTEIEILPNPRYAGDGDRFWAIGRKPTSH